MWKIFCWCLFDFATTVFMMNIVSLSFLQWLDQTFGIGNGQQINGIILTIAYTLTFFLYPFSGPICDKGHRVLPLFILTSLSIISLACLGLYASIWIQGLHDKMWIASFTIGFLFLGIYLTYQLALTFYNALLDDISTKKQRGLISGIGIAFRYCGALFGLFVLDFFIKGKYQTTLPDWLSWMVLRPCHTGQVDYANAFIPTAVMYFIFTIPLFIIMLPKKNTCADSQVNNTLNTTNQPDSFDTSNQQPDSISSEPSLHAHTNPFKMMITNCKQALSRSNTRWLLLTILLSGIPVYAAVGFMSKFLEAIGGIPKADLIKFLAFATVFSVLGGFGFGLFMRKLGSRISFTIILVIWTINLLIGSIVHGSQPMWIIGAFCGIGMGGYWAVSRILLLDISPQGQQGQYLSLYWAVVTICGATSSLLWPLCVTIAEYCNVSFAPERISTAVMGLLSLISLFAFFRVQFEPQK